MVILRSSGSVGAETAATTPRRRTMDLDTSSEFASLLPAPQRKSSRLTRSSRTLDDSANSPEHDFSNGDADMKLDEQSGLDNSLRTRRQRFKPEASFSEVELKTSSPVTDVSGGGCTRKSSRLQREEKASNGKQQADVPEEVEGSSTPKRSRFDLQRREVEEEDRSVRRSSRITRYKLDARNQSVLYDRLITNTAEAVLQKMDDMQKMRRRLRDRGAQEELGVYTRGRISRSLRTNVENKDTEESQGEKEDSGDDDGDEEVEEEDGDDDDDDVDDDEEEEDDEDAEEENQRRYDFRQRKTVVRYQAPLDEPREPRKRSMYFKDHSSPTRRRYRFSSTGPRSPYSSRRTNRAGGRKHNIRILWQ